jgi:tyrosyl-tRNA synthetase
MWRYFDLLSFRSMRDIEQLNDDVSKGLNPRDVKFQLCQEIVTRFHGRKTADAAQANFVARFQKGNLPDEMPEVVLDSEGGSLGVAGILKRAGLTGSTSEAFRMIQQGAVRIDGERVADREMSIESGCTRVFQVGKRRFARITLR